MVIKFGVRKIKTFCSKNPRFSTLMIITINVLSTKSSYYNYFMLSCVSFASQEHKSKQKQVILNCNNISQYYNFKSIFDQIKSALVSRRCYWNKRALQVKSRQQDKTKYLHYIALQKNKKKQWIYIYIYTHIHTHTRLQGKKHSNISTIQESINKKTFIILSIFETQVRLRRYFSQESLHLL